MRVGFERSRRRAAGSKGYEIGCYVPRYGGTIVEGMSTVHKTGLFKESGWKMVKE